MLTFSVTTSPLLKCAFDGPIQKIDHLCKSEKRRRTSREDVREIGSGVNLNNILRAAFSFTFVLPNLKCTYSLSLYFGEKEIGAKAADKMLVKLTIACSGTCRNSLRTNFNTEVRKQNFYCRVSFAMLTNHLNKGQIREHFVSSICAENFTSFLAHNFRHK